MQIDASRLISATENGVFYYDFSSGELSKLTKVDGLHEVKISAFGYDPESGIMLIGYKTGNLDVVSPEGEITYNVDIPLAQNLQGEREIRHISVDKGRAVISVDYGVSIFNLEKKEFEDTCFFPQGTNAKEATFFKDKIYVATNGNLYSHTLENNFSNFSSWTNEGINVTQLASDDEMMVVANSTNLYGSSGQMFSSIGSGFSGIRDVQLNENKIIVTQQKKADVIDYNGNIINTYQPKINTPLNTGIIDRDKIYVGSAKQGVLTDNSPSEPNDISIKPDGPYSNRAYRIHLKENKIWVAPGSDIGFVPANAPNLGYFFYDGREWQYPKYFQMCSDISEEEENCNTNDNALNVVDVLPSPSDDNVVYFTNFTFNGKQGVYKLTSTSDQVEIFNKNEVGRAYNYNFRPSGLSEKNGVIMASVGYLVPNSGVGLYLPEQDKLIRTDFVGDGQRPLVTDNTIWMGNPTTTTQSVGGIMAFLYNGSINNVESADIKYVLVENGLVDKTAKSYAMDQYGDLWIGENQGLRVLRDADNAIRQNDVKAEPIIIEQNGLGEELFRDYPILAIAVDAGNRKWISLQGGGVYYLSSDGQQTLAHFTAENSPLPSNTITDIQIDDKTGRVYFASIDGMVAYRSDITKVSGDFSEVIVYPNPVVYSQFKGNVTLKGLADKTHIRITDSAGNLVHKAVANGGVYYWDLNNDRGIRVASGIYFVLMTNGDGTEKKAVKIAVVN